MAYNKLSPDDDGSLAFLHIPRDAKNKMFHCPETSQQQEVGKTFYVMDYIEDVSTRHSRREGTGGRTLVLIADDPDMKEEEMRKFFSGSKAIEYTLREISNRHAFPRRVTLKKDGNIYYFV